MRYGSIPGSSGLRRHIDEAVRSSVEETLNGLLDAEAEAICGAGRYERSAERVDTRAGHHERKLETKAGQVTLKVPKLRSLPFETATYLPARAVRQWRSRICQLALAAMPQHDPPRFTEYRQISRLGIRSHRCP